MRKIREGAVELFAPVSEKVNSEMPVFYNPVMRLNRDITVLVLNAAMHTGLLKSGFEALDLLSATGVKGLRILKECKAVGSVTLNDLSKKAAKLINRNAELNKVKSKAKITSKPANLILQELKSYHFIDVDPFGSPVPFLDDAIKRLKPHGILGVTATDVSTLCGAYPLTCSRRYGSLTVKCPQIHEIGLRILIKKVQEVAAQYDVALTPIFSHSSNHYLRAFLVKETGAKKTDEVVKQFEIFQKAGPLWGGTLWDKSLTDNVLKLAIESLMAQGNYYHPLKSELDFEGIPELFDDQKAQKIKTNIRIAKESAKLAKTINEEAKISVIGFHDLHSMGLKAIPKIDDVIAALLKKGYKAARTHFKNTGIRTNVGLKQIKEIISVQLTLTDNLS